MRVTSNSVISDLPISSRIVRRPSMVVDLDLVIAHVERVRVGLLARHFHEDHVEAGDLLLDARRLVEAADAFHDHARGIDREDDALHGDLLDRLVEAERPVLPGEERVDDLEDLVLDAPPEVLRRDGAHLHQHLAVAHGRVTRRFDSSYCAWLILPLRRRNWPRECSGELELAKTISPSFQMMVRSSVPLRRASLPVARIMATKLRTSGNWMRERSP
jgi:hypothetical protein